MQIRDLFADEDAVSSVVSTVLMVAITIILVAVIGSFVLSMGGAVSETSPSATLSLTQTNITCNGNTTPAVTITHQGGDVVSANQLSVTVNDEPAKDCGGNPVWSGSGEVSAGDSARIVKFGSGNTLTPGNRLVVVWKSPSGDKSYILTQYTVKG